jgi:putative SOS response-associated peptidase YedK
VQEGGAGAVVTDNEERLFERLGFVSGKEQVVEQEASPGEERPRAAKRSKTQQTKKSRFGVSRPWVSFVRKKERTAMRQNRRKLYVIRQTLLAESPDFRPAHKRRP